MKTSGFPFVVFVAFILFFCFPKCASYYTSAKVISSTSSYPSTIAKGVKHKKYMMLHSGINLYTISSVQIDNAKENFTVHLEKADSTQIGYFKNLESSLYKPLKGSPALSQIHVFTSDSTSFTLDEPHTIPFSKVNRIELLGKH